MTEPRERDELATELVSYTHEELEHALRDRLSFRAARVLADRVRPFHLIATVEPSTTSRRCLVRAARKFMGLGGQGHPEALRMFGDRGLARLRQVVDRCLDVDEYEITADQVDDLEAYVAWADKTIPAHGVHALADRETDRQAIAAEREAAGASA